MKRHKSIISKSPEEVRAKITEALDRGDTLEEVAKLFEELTGQYISHKAASSFFHGEYADHVEKIRAAKNFASQISSAVGDDGKLAAGFDAQLQQRAFEVLTNPLASVKELAVIGKLVTDVRKQRLAGENLKLELEKFATSTKSKIEAGLEELGRQAKGDKRVLALLQEVQKLVNTELKAA